jgi:cellulose synthase/poly-beta-1,6-N-acetylglucosamine synthase-like glycosyltransferase
MPFAAKLPKLYSLNAEKLTYNRVGVLKRALDSAMNFAFQDYEIIVVDNGSTDATIVGDL